MSIRLIAYFTLIVIFLATFALTLWGAYDGHNGVFEVGAELLKMATSAIVGAAIAIVSGKLDANSKASKD